MINFYIKLIFPKFIIKIINKLFNREIKFIGNYRNWSAAIKNSKGYSDNKIFIKSKESFLQVFRKKAKFERDSLLFYSEIINYPLIKILNKFQKTKGACLNVLDFGGSFGSTYFQNYSILKNKNRFDWAIVEQIKLVKFMRKFKLEDNLNFYLSISNYITQRRPDVVLFSSVIQYLKSPYKIINFLIKKKIKFFLFLKTPFFYDKEVIKVQKVPKHIYDSSYPIRIFNQCSFLKIFLDNNYKVNRNYFPNEEIDDIFFKNFIFELKKNKSAVTK